MKILFISEYFPPKIMGGGEINLSLLAKALAQNNEVHVLTSYHLGLKRDEIINKVRIHRRLKTGENPAGIMNNFKRSLLFSKSIILETKNLSKRIHFDLIHLVGTSVLAAPKISRLKIPLIATVESYPALCPKGDRTYHGRGECKIRCSLSQFLFCQLNSEEIGKMKNKFYLKYNPLLLLYIFNYYKRLRKSLSKCKLIAISEYLQKILLQHGLKSTVIPNSIDLRPFKCAKNFNKNIKKQKKHNNINKINKDDKRVKIKIIYLGALIKSKGPEVLLKAIRGLDCQCHLYGKGILKGDLKRYIREKKIDAEIFSQVEYNKVPELYASADIVVFPSCWPEPFGRISIEAMASGKPIIGTEIGGIKETISPSAGILVKPNDIGELREAIIKLSNSPNLRKKIGERGKQLVKKFSEKVVTRKLLDFYGKQTKDRI